MPASVQQATVPAAPKSTSSGWALMTRMRLISESFSTIRWYWLRAGWLEAVDTARSGPAMIRADVAAMRTSVRTAAAAPVQPDELPTRHERRKGEEAAWDSPILVHGRARSTRAAGSRAPAVSIR